MNDNDLTRDCAPHYIERIQSVTPESQRQWGTMTPDQMFRHVTLAFKATLGEIEVQDRSTIAYRLVRPLLHYGLIKKPKGKVSAPDEYVATAGGDIEEARAELIDAIERFLDFAESNPGAKPRHPFFGLLTIPQWRRSHAKHLQYHLEQFGA